MDHAIQAVYRAIRSRLTATTESWASRAYADIAPAGVARPFAVWTLESGVQMPLRSRPHLEIRIDVRCTADDLSSAAAGAARIDALLHDADRGTTAALDGGTNWAILSSTRDRPLHKAALVDGRVVFSAGGRYRFVIERLT